MLDEYWPQYFPGLLSGIQLTFVLVCTSLILGFLGSVILATLKLSHNRSLQYCCNAYILFFRGTPLLAQLFLVYYGLSQFETVKNSVFWDGFLENPYGCAVLTMSMNAAAYMAEILYGAIKTLAYGQIEAATSLGMSRRQMYRRIILPQAFRQAIPAYGNEVILLIKGSALASTLTLMEITAVTRSWVARTYMPIEFFGIAALVYLTINFFVATAFRYLEIWLTPYRKSGLKDEQAKA